MLTDTIYVILKNAPMLEKETKILALQVVEANGVKQGDHSYSRAFITVTDRLFMCVQPEQRLLWCVLTTVFALCYGLVFVIPIGGADMPVVISVLTPALAPPSP